MMAYTFYSRVRHVCCVCHGEIACVNKLMIALGGKQDMYSTSKIGTGKLNRALKVCPNRAALWSL